MVEFKKELIRKITSEMKSKLEATWSNTTDHALKEIQGKKKKELKR